MAGKTIKSGGEAVRAVSPVISAGGTAVYPSDTVYGLLADGFSESACRRLALLKGYPGTRPFILLVKDIHEALLLTRCRGTAGFMEKHWPGPVTLVVPASSEVPSWAVGETGGVALRVPADWLSISLLNETGLKLASTSANMAGGPVPLSLSDVPKTILEGADLVIDGGELTGRPSKIFDLTGEEPRRIR